MSTVRILSLDGGGMRGLISAKFMELFVQQWGIDPTKLWQYFDVIAGSSIGGIQALAYSIGKTPAEIQTFFTEDGPWIFTTSTSSPSVEPSILSKISTMIGTSNSFYPSTTPGIGTMRLNTKLTSVFGSNTLQNAKTKVLITAFEKNDSDPEFEQNTNTPVYFSNSTIIPVLSGQNNAMVDVAMATSAAPLYFPSWAISTDNYIDGGVTQNNPATFALAVARALKPTANRACVLSIGTGLGDVGFPPSSSFKKRLKKELAEFRINKDAYAFKYNLSGKEIDRIKKLDELGVLEGAYLLMYLIGAMTTGPQEIAANELKTEADYTLQNVYQYRMQYYLDDEYDTDLDTSDPTTLQYYRDSATAYFNNDIDNISAFIGHLEA